MNKNLWLLALAQGFFLTNNVTFIGINGLVGLELAPYGWMATLPVMGYVVGGAMSTGLVAKSQQRWGRQRAFQIGLLVSLISALLGVVAVLLHSFVLLVVTTLVAGYYNANGQLYRFAAAELAADGFKEKAISLVLAGGLLGAVAGPYLATQTKDWFGLHFAGPYVMLGVLAVVAMGVMHFIDFGQPAPKAAQGHAAPQRSVGELFRQPAFAVAALSAAVSYGVMNLLMAATPLAMQTCGYGFDVTATVLQWHVIGMFAPGFFTGSLIQRFGAMKVLYAGLVLNALCVVIALSGQEVSQFLWSMLVLGVGWNFLFTASTTLSTQAYRPEEKDRAQGALNFCVFATMALTSFASGALVTTEGWDWLNMGSLLPLSVVGLALASLHWRGVSKAL
ncbi:MAG: MFS transporter [Betaproteobacteria bacterium]|jgi:MFS family permease|nr:MFS transporter [Betaproteobacteria bacterium]NBP46018.1 MFS transporter [Betaproteobacteria bacterium]